MAKRHRFAIGKLDQTAFLQRICCLEWILAPEPLEALQKGIQETLKEHCLRARPSQQAYHK